MKYLCQEDLFMLAMGLAKRNITYPMNYQVAHITYKKEQSLLTV